MSEKSDGDCSLRLGLEARAGFATTLGIPPPDLHAVKQVHGTTVLIAAKTSEPPEADGLVTNEPGSALTITVADCVPVYLYDPVQQAIGLLHAGRAGTELNIAAQGVARLNVTYGSELAHIRAFIGPSAGPERYEVSTEIAANWSANGLPANGRLLDLWGANRQQLIAAGLSVNNILIEGICTLADSRFFSYRSGDVQARNVAVLAL
jgi:hypothetical protein